MAQSGEVKRGRGKRILWSVVAVAVALFALRFWQLSGRESYASIAAIQKEEGKPVEVVTAAKDNLESWTTLAGTVEGSFQYPVVSTNSITVVEVLKEEGERVRAGDVIIRLETTAPNPMLYSYDRSLAVYQDALADLERMENLYKEGAVSKQALEKAKLALEVARTDLGNATGSTQLAATHAGIVTSVLVRAGEMAQAYTPLAWVARTDSVRVSFEAGSRQAMALRRGQKAVWRSPLNGDSGAGVLTRIDLSADPKSHLVRGEAVFPNPGGKLMPGVLLSFDVLSAARRDVVTIPRNCLVDRGGDWSVYAVEAADSSRFVARRRTVDLGLGTTDTVEIRSGVSAGDMIVIFGQSNLEDGDRVKIVRGGKAR